MIPDVNLKSYYLQYISNANRDIVKYKEDISLAITQKNDLYNYILDYVDALKSAYGINLNNYQKEWINKEYNNSETLYSKCVKLLNVVKEDQNRIVLIQVIKYCNALLNEHKANQLIVLANTRKNMKFATYSKYVTTYYNEVHKTVLQGMAYKFSNGIGTYCINYWKIDQAKVKKKNRIDFVLTNARKKEILAKGLKPYDDKEALFYKSKHMPYDGVEYRIYKNESSYYDFKFIKTTVADNIPLEYKRTEYVAAKYRGMSYKEMADTLCNTIEDVYSLQVDIKYKLNIIIYKDPNKYLNFIRNAEQCKYKRGAHNS